MQPNQSDLYDVGFPVNNRTDKGDDLRNSMFGDCFSLNLGEAITL